MITLSLCLSDETEIGKSSSTFASMFAEGVARQGEGTNKKRDARGKTTEVAFALKSCHLTPSSRSQAAMFCNTLQRC